MTLRLLALGALAAILGFLLSEYGYRGKRLFTAVAILMMTALGLEVLLECVGGIREIMEPFSLGEAAVCAVKVIGVGYAFGISADVCRELGEGGVATALTVAGRLEIFIAVLPYIVKMVKLGAEMIK